MGTALTTPAAPPPLDARGQPLLPLAFSHPSVRQLEVTDPGTGSVLFTFCKPKWFGSEWRLYEGQPAAPQSGAADEQHLLQVEPHLLQVEPRGPFFKGRKEITAGPAAYSGASESPTIAELRCVRRGWAFQHGGDGFLWREPRGRGERKAHGGYRRWLLCFRAPGGGGGGAEDAGPELVGAVKLAAPSRRFRPDGVLWLATDVWAPRGAKGAALGLTELLVTSGIVALQALVRSRNSG